MTAVAAGEAARTAFDRLSAEYDALAAGEIFRTLRERTHAVFARAFHRGCRVLEVGCGTGIDTAFLAGSGLDVLACDPAEGMVSVATRRLAQQGLADRATVLACGVADFAAYLDGMHDEPRFDGLVSNFGALNCVSDLGPVGAIAARHLRPGASIVLGLMGRSCAWEAAYFAITMRHPLVSRRRRSGPVPVPVAGVAVPTFYHRITDVRRALGAGVELISIAGVGVVVPPPYLEPRWRRLPALARRLCVSADRLVASWPPFNRMGDHVLLHFVKARGAHA